MLAGVPQSTNGYVCEDRACDDAHGEHDHVVTVEGLETAAELADPDELFEDEEYTAYAWSEHLGFNKVVTPVTPLAGAAAAV